MWRHRHDSRGTDVVSEYPTSTLWVLAGLDILGSKLPSNTYESTSNWQFTAFESARISKTLQFHQTFTKVVSLAFTEWHALILKMVLDAGFEPVTSGSRGNRSSPKQSHMLVDKLNGIHY